MNLLGSSGKSFSHTHVFKFPKSASFFDEVLILEMPNNITALKAST